MAIIFEKRKAFEKMKKFLKENQYSFEYEISKNKFFIKITEWD